MTVLLDITRAGRTAPLGTRLSSLLLLLLTIAAVTTGAAPMDRQQLDAQLEEAWKIDCTKEPAKAHAIFEQLRADAERLGLIREQADALRGLASVEGSQERNAEARALLEQALPLYRHIGDDR